MRGGLVRYGDANNCLSHSMTIELISCPGCGTKNASHRTVCLSCGINLPGRRELRTSLLKGVANFLAGRFYNKRAVICFGREFFEAWKDGDVLYAHNLDENQHSETVREYEQKGLLLSSDQKSMHSPDLGDCGECHLMYSYLTGYYLTGYIDTPIPSPPVRMWKVSASSGASISGLLDADLSRGRALYESPAGKQILERFGSNLQLLRDLMYGKNLSAVPIYQVSYLAMYDKARRLGLDDMRAHRYAFGRGNVYSFFSLLALRDQIIGVP